MEPYEVHATPSQEIHDWLTANGWYPGRDIGEEAERLIGVRLQDARGQGATLTPAEPAVRVIHTYGGLRLNRGGDNRDGAWIMKPTFGYRDDAADIKELAEALGVELFSVGCESAEFSLILVDETGRFFLLHHTGGYYAGDSDFDAFRRFIEGEMLPDAEDYFV